MLHILSAFITICNGLKLDTNGTQWWKYQNIQKYHKGYRGNFFPYSFLSKSQPTEQKTHHDWNVMKRYCQELTQYRKLAKLTVTQSHSKFLLLSILNGTQKLSMESSVVLSHGSVAWRLKPCSVVRSTKQERRIRGSTFCSTKEVLDFTPLANKPLRDIWAIFLNDFYWLILFWISFPSFFLVHFCVYVIECA